ncbi:PrsW family intramembrane metalloprotease [Patescibacteria group bacterium]|nr:PrsW family intramembrane metalloprotease [Patescibacteria group bacterium]MBU1703371.1 PrsW family intramembrane metalloprotease [Patescibacteria group bacterium]MBU1954070.1 PrsW family intramembrane metalloprotease [Patescibacteria group bacterium]
MYAENIFKFALALALAIIPACIWGYIFWKKQVGQKKMLFQTFVAGAVFVTPLLLYKYLWQYFPWINAFQYTKNLGADIIGFSSFQILPLNVIVTFMLVGVIEEIAKLLAVKTTDKKRICSIDDAIEMAVMAALGFAFLENILYFYHIMEARGVDGIVYPFIFRSLFSTFAHIMFSGVLGYYYGMALFATQEMQDKHNRKRWPIIRIISQIFHFKKNVLFHHEKITEGLIIAISLHAVFNIFLEMNWTFLIVPFLTGGYILVSYLLERKESHKVYCMVDNNRND